MEDPRPSQLRDRPDTGEAVYTRSSDGSVSDAYSALREGAALVDLSYRKILRLSGKKAVEMLNAVLTNQVPEEDRSDASWGVLGLYGPRAGDLLEAPDLAEHESAEVSLNGAALLAAGIALPVGGYDLLGPSDALETARSQLRERGAVAAGRLGLQAGRRPAGG